MVPRYRQNPWGVTTHTRTLSSVRAAERMLAFNRRERQAIAGRPLLPASGNGSTPHWNVAAIDLEHGPLPVRTFHSSLRMPEAVRFSR